MIAPAHCALSNRVPGSRLLRERGIGFNTKQPISSTRFWRTSPVRAARPEESNHTENSLAVIACITHLKHTIGSVITVDTGTSLLAPERVPDEGNRHGQYHAATRHHRSQGFGRTIVRRSTLGKGIRARSQCVRRPLKGGSDGGARRDPSPLRGDGRRRRNYPRAVLLDGSVDPRVVRSGDPSGLSAPQPDFGRAFGNRCRGRLWAWRTRPLFRYRPSVPAAVQADPPYRAGRR